MASKSKGETVLRYRGKGRIPGVPARHLTAHDVDRLAFKRAMSISGTSGERPDPAKPDPALVKTITAELIGSGLYKPED